jgi:hypothetical protein
MEHVLERLLRVAANSAAAWSVFALSWWIEYIRTKKIGRGA